MTTTIFRLKSGEYVCPESYAANPYAVLVFVRGRARVIGREQIASTMEVRDSVLAHA